MNETCRRIRELLAETMTNPAAATEGDDLHRHLESCPDCRSHMEALQQDHLRLATFARSMDAKLANLEDKVMESVNSKLDEAAVRPRVDQNGNGYLRRRPLRWALAAAVLVAVVLGFNLMDRDAPAGIAWAQVIDKVAAAEDYICRIHVKSSNSPETDSVQYTSAEHGIRQDMYMDDNLASRVFVDPRARRTVVLVDRDKRYSVMEMSDEQLADAAAGARPEAFVKEFRDLGFDEIGLRKIDGITASGIETRSGELSGSVYDEGRARLWVDVATQWPVRLEMEHRTNDGVSMKVVMTDFMWGAKLSAADFAYEIPADWKNMGTMARTEVNQESALQGLRNFASIMEGSYPKRLVFASVVQEYETAEKDMRQRGVMDDYEIADLLSIRETCEFFMQLETEDRDPAYYGDKVGRTDFDRVLLRWRLDDGDYRVIFGDLRQETVNAGRLAELESLR